MQNPFIPQKKANLALISGEASDEIIKNLNNKGIEVIKTIRVDSVLSEIAFHPDLILHPIAVNTLVVAPEVFDYYREKLEPYGLEIIKGENELGMKYPDDIKYNVFRIGDHFVHKNGYTDQTIMTYYEKIGLNLIAVSQGYSKCSIALVDNHSAITSDIKIAEKLTEVGYDILLIEKGRVELPGYEYGFIGGSSGHISSKEMVFTGSLSKHPDRANIEAFIKNKGIQIIELSKNSVIDLGTMFFFSI
ncbi:MAG: hypothetical protein RBR71_11980 [Gudongella sp.]|nr:hypothetical protein [Gudongella sp.]